MFEPLSREELRQLRIGFHKVQKQKDNWSDYVAKAEQKNTLKQVIELLNQYNQSVWGGFSGDIPPSVWAELQKEVEK
ncbi:hypothetical protein LCGC14_2808460 [marine sediment metagenome]|uniref:Uncharacterized protein n=1 Tax=marine sediment metagenome TaxID=412755 RepID=A0A0F8Z7G7_9ZZZZ